MLNTFHEMIANAIEHGCIEKGATEIKVSAVFHETSICFGVMDNGVGFNWHDKINMLAPPGIEADGGRGIFMISRFADHMKINEKGNSLWVRFCLKKECLK